MPSEPARGRLPDFFIVGQPKSGTTALYEMLRGHPEIFMPASKEPWFFADELLERPPPRPEGTAQTLEQYAELFAEATPAQRVGEASALYLWSRSAAARIGAACPDARIIAILREPAGLLHSLHLQFVQTYVEVEGDFAKALALEPARREGKHVPRHSYWPQALFYSEHLRYVEQLRRYEEIFGRERMLVLIYDEFRADNGASVATVLRSLGVEDTFAFAPVEANPTVQPRSQRLNELVHAVSVGRGPLSRAVKGAIKTVVPQRLRRGALGVTKRHLVFAEPKPPDERLMAELRLRYRGEVEALGEYLQRDLVKLWGYDGIG